MNVQMLLLFQRRGRFGHFILLVLYYWTLNFWLVQVLVNLSILYLTMDWGKHRMFKFKCSRCKGIYKVKNHKWGIKLYNRNSLSIVKVISVTLSIF